MSQTGTKTHDSDADEASNVVEERLRLIIDTIPTIVWRKLPDGSADFLNRNFREYTGLSLERGLGWGWGGGRGGGAGGAGGVGGVRRVGWAGWAFGPDAGRPRASDR